MIIVKKSNLCPRLSSCKGWVWCIFGCGWISCWVWLKSPGLTFISHPSLVKPPEQKMCCAHDRSCSLWWHHEAKLVLKLFQRSAGCFLVLCEGMWSCRREERRGGKRGAVTADYSSWSIPSIPDGVRTEHWLKTERRAGRRRHPVHVREEADGKINQVVEQQREKEQKDRAVGRSKVELSWRFDLWHEMRRWWREGKETERDDSSTIIFFSNSTHCKILFFPFFFIYACFYEQLRSHTHTSHLVTTVLYSLLWLWGSFVKSEKSDPAWCHNEVIRVILSDLERTDLYRWPALQTEAWSLKDAHNYKAEKVWQKIQLHYGKISNKHKKITFQNKSPYTSVI